MNNNMCLYIKKLLEQITEECAWLHNLQFAMKQYEKNIIECFESSNQSIDSLYSGHRISISDIEQISDWKKCFAASGANIIKGKEHFIRMNEIFGRECCFALSQIYERFESYLKNVCSIVINYDYVNHEDKIAKYAEKKGISADAIQDYRDVVGYIFNKDAVNQILKYFRKINSGLCNVSIINNRNINYFDFISVFTKARHAIVHNQSKIKYEFKDDEKNILKVFYNAEYLENYYIIKVSLDDVQLIAELLAEYSYQIYKHLSNQFDLKVVGINNLKDL